MSVANLLQTLGIQSVPPVPPANSCEGTEKTSEKQPRTPCPPCTPEKHRGAEKPPKRANPNAILLKVARQLQANPASLRAMLTDDDMKDITDGLNSPADMLDFFRLARENRELLADQRPPETPPPAVRISASRPNHAKQMMRWKPSHDAMINHLMLCKSCHAPRNRYCPEGLQLRDSYHAVYKLSRELPGTS